ncbi:uncharacterized protein LOC121913375 isoform X2 [Thunnus maccoyii]|uniref:uncharacterized protein LOC121913375 isoform X2 n=1 Tax=Thunnus maccoyii TaxID=8240 RepID=UPI001C4B1840|nr:uncharacterized protein LOC121913375 isoform X2 [Thunnus maccoyii]
MEEPQTNNMTVYEVTPVTTLELENIEDTPVTTLELENIEDTPVTTLELENIEDTPVTTLELENIEDTPVTTLELENIEDTPVTTLELENTEDTPVTTLEGENTIDQRQTTAESADPSASSESETEVESENQLRLFVTVLTVRVLTKCHAIQNMSQDEWVARIKRMVDQTMKGLDVSEGFCPELKTTGKACKAVIKDLKKKFCGKRLLKTVILLQDPVVDKAIIKTLQAHIQELSVKLAEKEASRAFWKDVLQVVALIVGSLVTILLMILIP